MFHEQRKQSYQGEVYETKTVPQPGPSRNSSNLLFCSPVAESLTRVAKGRMSQQN